MHTRQIYTKTIRLQKTAVDTGFAIFGTLQDHGGRMFEEVLTRNPWLPEESRRRILSMNDSCIDGSKYLKKCFDQGFSAMENLFAAGDKPEEKVATPPPSAAKGQTGGASASTGADKGQKKETAAK